MDVVVTPDVAGVLPTEEADEPVADEDWLPAADADDPPSPDERAVAPWDARPEALVVETGAGDDGDADDEAPEAPWPDPEPL